MSHFYGTLRVPRPLRSDYGVARTASSDGRRDHASRHMRPRSGRIKGICVLRTTTRQGKCAAYSEGFCVQYY
jgi:hypothetical protein